MAKKINYKRYRSSLNRWFFNLDKAVINALELYIKEGLSNLDFGNFKRPFIVGSGNAIETGKILFEDKNAIFANESSYKKKLDSKYVDGAVLISASGEKSAPEIVKKLKGKIKNRMFLTCNPKAPVSKFFDKKYVYVFPSLPEPYTYNTSTYLGMILAKTRENPKDILEFIEKDVEPIIPKNLGDKVFTFLVEKQHSLIVPMLQTKFIELFARKFGRDVFTRQYAEMHAIDVVKTPGELFVSFGYCNKKLGKERLNVPLPENAGYGATMAIGYYFCGKIQEQKPPWFKESIIDWCKKRKRKPLC